MMHRFSLRALLVGAAFFFAACSSSDDGDGNADAGADGDVQIVVDTSGACGVICGGGRMACPIEGFDPSDGIVECVEACQLEWRNEQNCVGDAEFVIECVDANRACDTLEDETCGNFPESSALYSLLQCLGVNDTQ